MTQIQSDLDIHRFIFQTSAQLKTASDPDKVMRHYLRSTAELMQADRACIAVLEAGRESAEPVFSHPLGTACDLALVTALLSGEQCAIPRGTICARLVRRDRPWGMLVLERSNGEFPDGYPKALTHVADEISERIARMDRDRLSDVRARIDGKMMRELPPKDLYYQILDGLHQLARYDHSAALWIWNGVDSRLELVAEQVAWRKMKSAMIGRTVTLDSEQQSLLGDGTVYGFDRANHEWREWTPHGAIELAHLLDLGGPETPERPRERAMLCAALGTRLGPLGVLKLSALAPSAFGPYELAIVERFTVLASIALQRAQTIESLQSRMLKVERQNALAQLARGVAHDINNALGEVIPLVQQNLSELKDGQIDRAVLERDLQGIEQSLQVTRGIFGRMMRFARGSSRAAEPGDVGRAFETVRDVLHENFTRLKIRLTSEIELDLPLVRCGQSDLERLFLNLMSNARDAMQGGGPLVVQASAVDSAVEVVIEDRGAGMNAETLRAIEHPFFTTKELGTGLGLSACRSIVAESGGSLRVESELGAGTRVTALLPIAPPAAADA